MAFSFFFLIKKYTVGMTSRIDQVKIEVLQKGIDIGGHNRNFCKLRGQKVGFSLKLKCDTHFEKFFGFTNGPFFKTQYPTKKLRILLFSCTKHSRPTVMSKMLLR
jgi:hypothetical protein